MSARTHIDLAPPWTGSVDIESVVPNPDQPRKHFDQAKLASTARSLGIRQIAPIGVIALDPPKNGHRWMIIDGERRWRGLKAIGSKQIKIAYDPEITREELFEASLAANFCREGHTKEEIARAVWKLRDKGMSQAEISEKIGQTQAWVSDYCLIRTLHADLLRSMDFPPAGERKVTMSIAKLLAPLPPFDQLGQWEKHKHLPSGEAFHKLRCSGKVRHGTERSPVEDADYVQSQASVALKKIEALINIPLPMMKRLSAENIAAVMKQLAKISTRLDEANDRFARAAKECGD